MKLQRRWREGRQDITESLEGEGKVAGRVAEIKNPIAHWVVMRNLIRSLETGPAEGVWRVGELSPKFFFEVGAGERNRR